MNDPYLIALVGVAGGIVGSLITTLVTYKLNERSRMLDVYKTVYPAKVNAATEVMSVSNELFFKALEYRYNATDDEKIEMEKDLRKMLWQAQSFEALLGARVVEAAVQYYKVCIDSFIDPKQGTNVMLDAATFAPDASRKKLIVELRQSLHLDKLDNLLL